MSHTVSVGISAHDESVKKFGEFAADVDVMPMRTGLTRRSHSRVRSGPW